MFLLIKLFDVRIVLGDTIIDHDLLKTHAFVNTPKYWFHYIRQFLYNVINKHKYSVDTQIFLKLAKQLLKRSKRIKVLVPNCDDFLVSGNCSLKEPGPGVQRQYTVADRIYQSLVYGRIYNSGEIIAPVGGRSVYRTIVSEHVRSLHIDYRFIFRLELYLRLNITFHHIHIIHKKLKIKCEYDYIVIASFSVENQVYCGLLSYFVVILPDNELIAVELKTWTEHVYFDVKFDFSVTDPDRITSETTRQSDILRFSSWAVYFPQTGLLFQRLILKVKRFLSLKITVRSTIDTDVYDGPDLLCSKIRPVTTNETEIIHIYITSLFKVSFILDHFMVVQM